MVQKLSSIKQQNHLKEGHKGGGAMFKFVGKLFNLVRRWFGAFNPDYLEMKFDEKWTLKIMWFSKINVGLGLS